MEDGAVRGKHRSVAGTVPCSVRIVPCHSAALVRAFRRQPVILTPIVAEHRYPIIAPHDHASFTRGNVCLAAHDRLAVAVLVEILRYATAWVIELLPRACALDDEIADHHARRRAIADPPGVETGGDEITRRLFGIGQSCQGNAIESIVVLVAPAPSRLADGEVPLDPALELSEPRGDIAVRTGVV